MKLFLLLAVSLFMCSCSEKSYTLHSPDQKIKFEFTLSKEGVANYQIYHNNELLIAPSKIGINFADNKMDSLLEIDGIEIEKNKMPFDFVNNCFLEDGSLYNGLIVRLQKDNRKFQIQFRIYNDGVATQYFMKGYQRVLIKDDYLEVSFPHNYQAYWSGPKKKGEKNDFFQSTLSNISPIYYSSDFHTISKSADPGSIFLNLPFIAKSAEGKFINIQSVSSTGNKDYTARFNPHENSISIMIKEGDLYQKVIPLPVFSPWTVIGIAEDSKTLFESNIAYNLAIEDNFKGCALGYPHESFDNFCNNNTILPFCRHERNSPGSLQSRFEQNANATIGHQLGLNVIFNFPFIQVKDKIQDNDELKYAYEFIKQLPSKWVNHQVLTAELGKYLVVARQGENPNEWFVGGITNNYGRKLTVNFDFLDDNALYEAYYYQDQKGTTWEKGSMDAPQKTYIRKNNSITTKLVGGGGFAIRLIKVEDDSLNNN